MLDNTLQVRYDTIEAGIDDTQLAWLKADLEAMPAAMPTVLCAHIPIVFRAGAGQMVSYLLA